MFKDCRRNADSTQMPSQTGKSEVHVQYAGSSKPLSQDSRSEWAAIKKRTCVLKLHSRQACSYNIIRMSQGDLSIG